MRERAELAGGEVIAGPAATGFEVVVRLPIETSQPKQTAAAT
jgi:signal transduction histidine kinase